MRGVVKNDVVHRLKKKCYRLDVVPVEDGGYEFGVSKICPGPLPLLGTVLHKKLFRTESEANKEKKRWIRGCD